MHQMAGTVFGVGTPFGSALPTIPWGFSPQIGQGLGFQSLQQQPYLQPQFGQSIGAFGVGPVQPVQQALQLLQIVPQQLQQVQWLQQQQLVYLQQLLQIVPAQLQQLQQLIQIIPQQVHQQQWQPYAQSASGQLGFGFAPQAFGGQTTSHVM